MSAFDAAIWPAMVLLSYVVAPGMLIWGWIRFRQQPKQKAVISYLSLIGFVLTTASAVVGLCTILLAPLGNFPSPHESLFLRRAIQLGGILSLAGILFSLAGVWRKSPTRWQAPASAIGTLAFWLMIAILAFDD